MHMMYITLMYIDVYYVFFNYSMVLTSSFAGSHAQYVHSMISGVTIIVATKDSEAVSDPVGVFQSAIVL